MPFVAQPSPYILFAERLLPAKVRSVVLNMLWVGAIIAALLALFVWPGAVGMAFLLLGIASGYTFLYLFFNYGIEEPPLPEALEDAVARNQRGDNINVIPFCSGPVIAALPVMQKASVSRVLLNLFDDSRATMILRRLAISHDEVKEALKSAGSSAADEVSAPLAQAAEHAVRHGHERIMFADALEAFAKASPGLQELLFNRELSLDDLDAVAHWEDRIEQIREKRRRFWTREYLFGIKPFGREWAFGFTPTIDRFAIDLTAQMEGRTEATSRTLGHMHEIQTLERSLAKTSSTNGLLVYEPGIGVRDILGGFAGRVLDGRSLPTLNYRRVLAADFGAAVSGLKTAGEIEGRVRQMLAEAGRAGGTILVVENIHQLLGGEIGGQPIDLTATFLPFLEGSRIQIVATTTFGGLHERLEKREGVMTLFEKTEAIEPDEALTIQILLETLPVFERRFGVYVSYPVLKSLVQLADQTIQDVPFPKKAYDVLEEAMIAAQNAGENVLSAERAASVISERTRIPVGALTDSESEKLKHLEDLLHKRVVGQEHAVSTIANALRRARAGVRGGEATRPIGTFLFMGPTGVGKTETAKAIAEVYFGSEDQMQRLDMSEFQSEDAVDRLIGSPGTGEEGRLTTMIREEPFCVLLLDEFEKMHRRAMDIFLPVFDEGEMQDGWGRNVSFTNVLIIATSNAGAEFIREWIDKRGDDSRLPEALREEVMKMGIFKPELLNRFDGTVVYKPLTQEQVREIARRMLSHFSDTMYDEKGIRVEVAPDALEVIMKEGFRQEFGARELRRVMQEKVETVVANRILEKQARRGDTVTIQLSDVQ